jgi:hypothetical protein
MRYSRNTLEFFSVCRYGYFVANALVIYSLILDEKIRISTVAFEKGPFKSVCQLTTYQRERIKILA